MQRNYLGQDKINRQKRNGRQLRFHSAVMCIYFLISLLLSLLINSSSLFCISAIFMVIYGLGFYFAQKRFCNLILYMNYLVMICFVITHVVMYGWDSGVQRFLLLSVIMMFTTGNLQQTFRMGGTVCCFLIQIGLYLYAMNHAPLQILSGKVYTCFQILNGIGVLAGIYCTLTLNFEESDRLFTETELLKESVERNKKEDALTGIRNSRSAMDYLQVMTDELSEKKERKVSIVIGDLDFFHRINERCGHNFADVILKQIAVRFESFMDGKGIVARWGGDEFLFVFNREGGEEASHEITELQKQLAESPFLWNDEKINLTVTFGVAEYDREKGIDSCVAAAGKKMMIGKDMGRNTVIM